MRLAARRDSNEPEIVKAITQLGGWWIAFGPLDGWVYHRGRWTPTENKSKRGKYTDFQKKFLALCKANNAPVFTFRSPEDAITSLNGS